MRHVYIPRRGPGVRIIPAAFGHPFATRVIDADTGNELRGVRAVTWRHEAEHAAIATIEVFAEIAPVEQQIIVYPEDAL